LGEKLRYKVLAAALLALFSSSAAATPPHVYPVYTVDVVVATTSDWTEVIISGAFLGDVAYSVKDPHHTGVKVRVSSNKIKMVKGKNDARPVAVRVSGLLFALSHAPRVEVKKGAIGFTSVEFYRGRNLAASFNNSGVVPGDTGENRRYYVLDLGKLGEPDYHMATWVKYRPKLVLAFYYPWYGNRLTGGDRHWGRYSWGHAEAATHFPLLGPYSSLDPRVVRTHIELAKCYGVDGFIVSWWGVGSYEDKAFAQILSIAEGEGFRVTVYYESKRGLSVEDAASELSYILVKYSRHPAFLKLGGKPVIFVYAADYPEGGVEYWRRVLGEAEERSGVDALFIADTRDANMLSVFDGLHTYFLLDVYKSPLQLFSNLSVMTRVYATREELSSHSRRPRLWVATVMPGFNSTKADGPRYSRLGGDVYKSFWLAASSTEPDMVAIISWNEWHEGTEIEPSLEYGFKYLALTKSFAEKYKGSTASCPDSYLEASGGRLVAHGYVPVIWVLSRWKGASVEGEYMWFEYGDGGSLTVVPGLGDAETLRVVDAALPAEVVYWSMNGSRITLNVGSGGREGRVPGHGRGSRSKAGTLSVEGAAEPVSAIVYAVVFAAALAAIAVAVFLRRRGWEW